ncbi:MAG TPA: helical backbone metal receptor [Sphingobacteriaceae bacterium]
MGRDVEISYPPQRIISLVPSQTELLVELGLSKRLAGITKFCIHPAEKLNTVVKVGGTKQLKIDKIRDLRPDLIIGNKEENDKSQIDALIQEFPVWMSDIETLNDSFHMMRSIGDLTGKAKEAEHLVDVIRERFTALEHRFISEPVRIAYFIWKDPYMVAGQCTFINEMLEIAGWVNVFNKARYPVVTADEIREAKPDVLFLSSEPYPFKEKHIAEFMQICPAAMIITVDGELFSWYGSRLKHTPGYLRTLQSVVNQPKRDNNKNMF